MGLLRWFGGVFVALVLLPLVSCCYVGWAWRSLLAVYITFNSVVDVCLRGYCMIAICLVILCCLVGVYLLCLC